MDNKIASYLLELSVSIKETTNPPSVVDIVISFCREHYSRIHKDTYKYILKAIRIAQQYNMHSELLCLNTYKAFYLLHHGKRKAAKRLGLSIKEALLAGRFFFEYGLIHIILSQIEWAAGQLEQAFLTLNAGLDQLKKKRRKKEALVQLHWMLGVFYYDLNDNSRSFYHYTQSHKAIEVSTDIAMRAYIQIGLATLHAKRKNYEKAAELLQLTASVSNKHDMWLVESRSYYELGMLNIVQNQHELASADIQKSYQIRKDNAAVPAMISSMIAMVEIKIKVGAYPQAESILQEALQICEKRQLKSKKSTIYYLLSEVYAAQKMTDKAYPFLKEHYSLEKEINRFQQKNMNKYFQMMYNMEKAKKDAEFQKLLNSELQKSNAIILQQKTELQKGNKEKEVLLKEIHHRVKNNLQIITSLFTLQSLTASDEVKEVFENSQHRINSMALIHEMLYQSDTLSYINYKDYLHQLISKLILSFMGKDHSIEVQMHIPDMYLSIDTAIPLSLLVNEIVTNALKYAFKDTPKGILTLNIYQDAEQYYTLYVGDDGPGLPANFNWRKSKSLGMKLIHRLAKQIDGFVELDEQIKGTHFFVKFFNQ